MAGAWNRYGPADSGMDNSKMKETYDDISTNLNRVDSRRKLAVEDDAASHEKRTRKSDATATDNYESERQL